MKRTLLQRKGISATHPILLLAKEDQIIVCSVASADGKSNFDYSLVLNAKDVNLDGTDEEIITSLCQTEYHLESEWGWMLAISYGVNEEEIESMQQYIDINNPRSIRLSKATRVGIK